MNLDWLANGYVSQSFRGTFSEDTRMDRRLVRQAVALEYRVTGSAARVSTTISNCSGGTSQFSNVSVPWSFTCSSVPTGQVVYVSAQNQQSSGCVRVAIYKRGSLYRDSESCGAFVIATASGSY